jgi:hypothetical protein
MPARIRQFWITLAAALLVACGGCDLGGASPTGEGAPPGAVASSAAAASVAAASGPATDAAAGSQPSSGGGNGRGNSAGGNSGGGNSGGGNSGGGNSGGGGAQGAPLQIPAIILQQGADLQTEYNAVVSDVTSACGGAQCVSVSTAGAGLECNFTVTVNGVIQVDPPPSTDSQGNQVDIVPRGATIVINGNADGSSDNNCPSDNSGSSGGGSPSAQPSPSL